MDYRAISIFKKITGLIYAFNVSLPPKVKELARQRGVTVKNHNVIYKLVDDIKEEITKRLPTKQVEESLGSFENYIYISEYISFVYILNR